MWWGTGLAVGWLASLLMFVTAVLAIALIPLGIGAFATLPMMTLTRQYIGLRRRLRDRYGRAIESAYRPPPELSGGVVGVLQRTQSIVTDSATWRDIGWLLLDGTADLSVALSCLLLRIGVAGIWQSPRLMKAYVQVSGRLLAPTEAQLLRARVEQLRQTRSDAVDSSAAELRRIERDLHDGAQARLVAMGMSLGAIERLMDRDPERARLRVAEARAASAKALTELRDLVHGIHPPVLAERGLGDAIRALALDLPLRTEVGIDLPGRLTAPVESAVYFTVSELLANAAKYSGASLVRINASHRDGRLCVSVTDDGRGGADASAGTGLRGIQRRLSAFDGILTIESPPGGPTTATVELPCALPARQRHFSP